MAFGHWYPWQLITRQAGLPLTHRFEETFDVGRLQEDLAAVLEHHDVVPHYRSYLANGWGAITLVGPNGDAKDHRSVAVAGGDDVRYEKTPAMDHAPYIESLMSLFPGDRCRVRLMRLTAGRKIFWHHDGYLFGLDRTIARFHIPIITNPGVQLQVSHEDCHWEAGRLFFLDNSFPHRLMNAGDQDRVHLVFDMQVGPEILDMFPAEFAEQAEERHELRETCMRWIDNSLGQVYRAQKRWQMKKAKLQKVWQRVSRRRDDVVAPVDAQQDAAHTNVAPRAASQSTPREPQHS